MENIKQRIINLVWKILVNYEKKRIKYTKKHKIKKGLTKCHFSVIMYKNQGGATTWTSDKDRCSTEQDSNIVGF